MDIVTLDFETYYDAKYSLKKLTTEAYIRDSRFEVIGVGIKINDKPCKWFSGSNVVLALKAINWSDKAVLCHNTVFDGAILSWLYNIKPALWLDTLSMARPYHTADVGLSLAALANRYNLGKKGDEVFKAVGLHLTDFSAQALHDYGVYCCTDVDLTYALFKCLKTKFNSSELLLIDRTIRMYTEPEIELDTVMLDNRLKEINDERDKIITECGLTGDIEADKKTLMSNVKFADVLRGLAVSPPTKRSPATGRVTWAFGKTDPGFIALKKHNNPVVRKLVEARLAIKSTIEQSRVNTLSQLAKRGRLPVMLHYYGAHTGRFSGGDKINLQNLPRGGTLRASLRAPKGKVLIACDSSQIEARMVAWLAQQTNLLDAFRKGRDVYSEFATSVYGKQISKADKLERFVGKTCILGLGYGMGNVRFAETLKIGSAGLSLDLLPGEAVRIVELYRTKYKKIKKFWGQCGDMLIRMARGESGSICNGFLKYDGETIYLPNGMELSYNHLTHGSEGFGYINSAREYKKLIATKLGGPVAKIAWTYIYGGKLTENITQALARIVVSEQLMEISKRYKVVLQVHDEVVISVDKEYAAEAKAFMERVMSTPPTWASDLPVACEASVGETYGDCK